MIYLVEVTAATDSAGTTTVLRFSTEYYTTGPAESPANTYYEPRVRTPADITRNMFSQGTTSGSSRVGYGVVELSNTDGGLDYMVDYGFDDRLLEIKIGNHGDAYSSFTTIVKGTMEQVEFTFNTVTILARDKLAILDLPIQKTEYAGTNTLPNGVEGTTDIKGQKKPLLFGQVYNISPPMVNTSKLIFEVSNGLINDVSSVYDMGASLTKGADYTDMTDMMNNAPSASNYRILKTSTGSYFRLGSSPVGLVTCDAVEGASASNRTAAQIIKALALKAGIDAGDINASDVTTLDSANSSVVGIWIFGDENGLSAIDQVAQSIGAWYGYDSAGAFRMGRFELATGAATIDIDEINILSIEALRTSDTDRGLPAYKVILNHTKNYTVQDTDLAGSVSVDRRNTLRYESKTVISEDATVKTQYNFASEIVRNTLLIDATAASNEASRLLTLYKSRRRLYEVRIAYDPDIAVPEINGIASLTLDRFGLDSGKLFRIIGISSNYATNRATLTLWG